MATSSQHPFSAGDRVVYRDREVPWNPLAGEVVDVNDHAVLVRYDDHPASAVPGRIAVEQVTDVLRFERDDARLDVPAPTPGYWTGPNAWWRKLGSAR